jgi:hypothetical protein
MVAAFLLTFLDALDAFLLAGVAAAYARKTRQLALASAVRWGVAASLVISVAGAWWSSQTTNLAPLNRRSAIAAALAVVALMALMWRRHHLLLADREDRPGASDLGGRALMFVFTALVLSREGMQMVPLLTVFLVHVPIVELRIAVVSGLVLAAVAAWTWARQAPRLRRRWFAAATAIILLLGTTQLVIDAWRSTNAPPRVDLEVTLDQ